MYLILTIIGKEFTCKSVLPVEYESRDFNTAWLLVQTPFGTYHNVIPLRANSERHLKTVCLFRRRFAAKYILETFVHVRKIKT